ncbi:hypothetical protein G6F70_001127 [Rhizopus microsporus]|nr:hypothetical protein G6F71_001104 [Rhizopus microsporus]KAG1203751.1 hypothetical protein G6F70_001127 [Rhizopus microsporus]KAG1216416.1 hypothetical protein G6F69_000178 [Rhizopus microsporus]KAG1237705.1 hypothetical protein G6F67_001023 [Rhizopus microsporus]KAG1267558.1 hypothetical protein G6F68_001840 [Rhizopus microsporus]
MYNINTVISTIYLSKRSSIEDLVETEFASGKVKSTSFHPALTTIYDASLWRPHGFTLSVKKHFEELYNDKCDQMKVEKNKRRLNQQILLISQSDVTQENQNRLLELEEQLSNLESPSVSISTTLSSKNEMEDIKEIIFNHDLWAKLTAKYISRFKALPTVVDVSLVDKWAYIINMYNQLNGVCKAKKHLNHLKNQDNLEDTIEKVFDFFEEILILVESKEFMLNTTNFSKVSEEDYVYQIWLPLFSKLFNINKSIVGIKTAIKISLNVVPNSTLAALDVVNAL